MDSKEYIKQSERTEVKLPAQDLKPEFTVRLPQMMNLITITADTFDDFKKQLYYGAPIEEDVPLKFTSEEGNYHLAMTAKKLRILHGMIGCLTESCELGEQVFRHIYMNEKLDEVNLKEEMGDIFWYLALLARELDVSFEDLMDTNIKKLQARFPEKFDQQKALVRDLDAERKILEDGK